jgi:hypothetical protein
LGDPGIPWGHPGSFLNRSEVDLGFSGPWNWRPSGRLGRTYPSAFHLRPTLRRTSDSIRIKNGRRGESAFFHQNPQTTVKFPNENECHCTFFLENMALISGGSRVVLFLLGLTSRYSRVAHSDLPTPAPRSLRISPRPQMEGEG